MLTCAIQSNPTCPHRYFGLQGGTECWVGEMMRSLLPFIISNVKWRAHKASFPKRVSERRRQVPPGGHLTFVAFRHAPAEVDDYRPFSLRTDALLSAYYWKWNRQDNAACSWLCEGDSTQYCGGAWAVSVVDVDAVAVATASSCRSSPARKCGDACGMGLRMVRRAKFMSGPSCGCPRPKMLALCTCSCQAQMDVYRINLQMPPSPPWPPPSVG